MFEMNEEFFAELQKDNCWFTFSMFEDLPKIDPNGSFTLKEFFSDDILFQRHLFALIFVSFGYKKS